MIVRTYTRRAKSASRSCSAGVVVIGSSSSSSASSLDVDVALPQDSIAAPEDLSWSAAVPFDSQSSYPGRSPFELDPFGFEDSPAASVLLPDAPVRALKEPPKDVKGKKLDLDPRRSDVSVTDGLEPASTSTSTLMEAQEFGEMMEHVDEVNFALDGLRLGQPVRIRRASLLSLLSVCASSQQRRLLRAQGLVKKIIDAVLGLQVDDSSSTVAAATVLYILASDAQDDHMLESRPCIQFIVKLLNHRIPDTVAKPHSLGSRLLVCDGALNSVNKKLDSSPASIILKVQEILVNCKEIKPLGDEGDKLERPELTAKWIALLTMEKACLSSVSFEETSGKVRKVGGDFKERLREFGGLDAVFSVAANCHSSIEGMLKNEQPLIWELNNPLTLESVVLLLKCLKIMENATFLSKENQNHLLKMNSTCGNGLSISCVDLIISSVKVLSGLSLRRNSTSVSNGFCKDMKPAASRRILNKTCKESCNRDSKVNKTMIFKSFEASEKRQKISPETGSSSCTSETTHGIFPSLRKKKDVPPVPCDKSSSSQRRGFPSNSSSAKIDSNKGPICSDSLKTTGEVASNGKSMDRKFLGKRPHASRENLRKITDDIVQKTVDKGYDPFAFDEDDLGPSKWEIATKRETDEVDQSRDLDKDLDELHENLMSSISEVLDGKNTSPEPSPSILNKDPGVLEECLLTAVKVLMNLTNDNPEGCQMIASCGGLDTMAALIISHFPSFDSSSTKLQENKEANDLHKHLNDYELDFLVAILGLLVNLVEKDDRNRSRLVCAKVPLVHSGKWESKETHTEVIPLLCTIFLANQGAGEAAGENMQCNDELALMQGEREAEMMIIEAYAALLLAFLSTESGTARKNIACCLPDDNLKVLVPVLERFVDFHLSLNMISPETHSAVSEVIESCRIP